VGTPFAAGTSTAVFLATTRTNGKRLLVAGNGHVFDPARGVDLGSSFSGGYYGNLVLAVSQDGTRLAATDTGLSPSGFLVYSTDYTAANGGKVLFNVASWGSGGSNGQDVALSADGARLYTACGAPYEFGVFDVTGGAAARALTSLPGVPYPRNVEVARDGRIIGGADGYYNAVDTWIYDPSGTLLASTKLSGYARTTLPRQLKISGDGLRLAALTDDPYLRFFTIAP
jgi:hypothetical protein